MLLRTYTMHGKSCPTHLSKSSNNIARKYNTTDTSLIHGVGALQRAVGNQVMQRMMNNKADRPRCLSQTRCVYRPETVQISNTVVPVFESTEFIQAHRNVAGERNTEKSTACPNIYPKSKYLPIKRIGSSFGGFRVPAVPRCAQCAERNRNMSILAHALCIQRKVKFITGSVSMQSGGGSIDPMTHRILNKIILASARPAAGAMPIIVHIAKTEATMNGSAYLNNIKMPQFHGNSLEDGRSECWIHSVPQNTGSFKMELPMVPPWRMTTTKARVGTVLKALGAFVPLCRTPRNPRAGALSIFRLTGKPDDATFWQQVRAHEAKHVADWRKAFFQIIGGWDKKVTKAMNQKRKWSGWNKTGCEANALVDLGGADLGAKLRKRIKADADRYHAVSYLVLENPRIKGYCDKAFVDIRYK